MIYNQTLSSLPVLIIGEEQTESFWEKAIEIGAFDYLEKGSLNEISFKRALFHLLQISSLENELESLKKQQEKYLKMATLGEMTGGIVALSTTQHTLAGWRRVA